MSVSVVIPTFGRETVLLATLEQLLALARPADQIVVVDQTHRHEAETARRLAEWSAAGRILWRRRARPSIPGAMNEGLLAATGARVLFLDDDVELWGDIVAAHESAAASDRTSLVAGQVLQPGENPEPLTGARFAFRSSSAQRIGEFMAGNFSVDRARALAIGGFDESFVGAAYRFERDFAERWLAAGGSIRFEPAASIRHLRAPAGGTRSFGVAGRTWHAGHSVGEYYYLLRHRPPGGWRTFLSRPLGEICSRHHLRHPWWIPVTLAVELAGMARATMLALGPPRLLPGRPAPGDPC